ncbi:uncharacterized protein LOC120111489 [Phoenix dactylifera]|uniref:Uncharacterized protein LOC120111489 n=1 Tax=Phoenix dactylifera TaxID=42345 RepID=A0A8B9AFC4_PHODC|nr:uncharacterized protein LOC120111489 [Phoenix dactylifera]
MTRYIQSLDFELWDRIVDGPYILMKTVNDVQVPKEKKNMIKKIEGKCLLIVKQCMSYNVLLDINQSNRISICNSAKEIWDKLEIGHEGTSQVKESKIDILTMKYELFKMEPHEDMKGMFTHFPMKQVWRKVLWALPSQWEAKRTAIIEAFKNQEGHNLEELMVCLLTHELTMKTREEMDSATCSKGKVIVLKSQEEYTSNDEEDEDEEITLLTRKFRRIFIKKYGNKNSNKRYNYHSQKGDQNMQEIVCYGCNKAGHIKSECPYAKKKKEEKKKKKAMLAIWDDSSDKSNTDQEKDEIANLCLMAKEDNDAEEEVSGSISFDDLLSAYNDLASAFIKIKKRNKLLKKDNARHMNAVEIHKEEINKIAYNDEHEKIKKENENLKVEIDALKKTFSKCSYNSEQLEHALACKNVYLIKLILVMKK